VLRRPQQAPKYGQKTQRPLNDNNRLPQGEDVGNTVQPLEINKDYTPIDQPSRDPSSQDPSQPRFPGNRYEINGNRRPYNDNNPNKERRPVNNIEPNPVPVIGNGNQIIGTKYGIKPQDNVKDLTITNSNGQYQVIQTRYDGGQLDPSFTVSAGYSGDATPPAYIDKTVGVGLPAPIVEGSVDNTQATIDYQGWYTEGDTIKLPRQTAPSRFYDDINIKETEAPKTTTYANEWNTYKDDYRTRIPFNTKSRPAINTNFRGEWTAGAGEEDLVNPTRPFGVRVTNYDPRENNNWNSFGGNRPTQQPSQDFGNAPTSQLQTTSTEDKTSATDGTEAEAGRPSFPTSHLENGNRQRQPGVSRPGPNARRPPPFRRPPTEEEIVFGRPRPQTRPRLPPIQQPPRRNDVVGIPNAILPSGENLFRPQRRRPSLTSSVEPQTSQEWLDNNDEIAVIEGTFENRPVIILKTDDVPFRTNVVIRPTTRLQVEPDSNSEDSSTRRRTRIKLTSTRTRTADTFTTREFPPGTFINIDPTTSSTASRSFRPTRIRPSTRDRPTILAPTIAIPQGVSSDNNRAVDETTTERPRVVTSRPRIPGDRPVFPPKIIRDGNKPERNEQEKDESKFKTAGAPFLPAFGKRPYVKNDKNEDEAKRKETLNVGINPAIVEGIPGNALSAEDSDPETRCQNTCGQNEICQINVRGGIECKCRPGFGKTSERSPCQSNYFKSQKVDYNSALKMCRHNIFQNHDHTRLKC
jgi:hypothetical protein